MHLHCYILAIQCVASLQHLVPPSGIRVVTFMTLYAVLYVPGNTTRSQDAVHSFLALSGCIFLSGQVRPQACARQQQQQHSHMDAFIVTSATDLQPAEGCPPLSVLLCHCHATGRDPGCQSKKRTCDVAELDWHAQQRT